MSWTYNLKEPATRDKVRLLVGDTLAPPKNIFEDEELDTLIALESSDIRLSAALALDTIANNSAKAAIVIQMPGVNLTMNQVPEVYADRAATMRSLASLEGSPEFANLFDTTSELYDTVLGRSDIEYGEEGESA